MYVYMYVCMYVCMYVRMSVPSLSVGSRVCWPLCVTALSAVRVPPERLSAGAAAGGRCQRAAGPGAADPDPVQRRRLPRAAHPAGQTAAGLRRRPRGARRPPGAALLQEDHPRHPHRAAHHRHVQKEPALRRLPQSAGEGRKLGLRDGFNQFLPYIDDRVLRMCILHTYVWVRGIVEMRCCVAIIVKPFTYW